jgi:hypothetical protein
MNYCSEGHIYAIKEISSDYCEVYITEQLTGELVRVIKPTNAGEAAAVKKMFENEVCPVCCPWEYPGRK